MSALARWLEGRGLAWLWAEVRAASARTGRPLGMPERFLELVDWERWERDPLRRQFLPVASELEPDHPSCRLDPLAESGHQPTPGLVHRYPDRALLLASSSCPVYCAFCTRSWLVSRAAPPRARREGWQRALDTLAARPAIRDVTISGGDPWMLPAEELAWLGEGLLALPGLERLRLGSRGLTAMPERVLQDCAWREALETLAAHARERGVRIALHAHVNHPTELGVDARSAAAFLLDAGFTLRSQTVLLRGVNDELETMRALVRSLVGSSIQPYYVFTADLAPGSEHLRTDLATALELEKDLRGLTAGFDLPTFVCDVLGGGGKRGVHSYERYARDLGVAVFRSPAVDAKRLYLHCDPLRTLSADTRSAWLEPRARERLVHGVLEGLMPAGFPSPWEPC